MECKINEKQLNKWSFFLVTVHNWSVRGERRETGNAVANWQDHHSLDLFSWFYNLKNKRSLSSKNKFRNLRTIWLFLASFVVTEETSDKPSWLVEVGLLRQHHFSIKGEFCDMISKELWKCLHLLTHISTINIYMYFLRSNFQCSIDENVLKK